MNSFTVVFLEHFTSPEDRPNVLQQDFTDVPLRLQHKYVDFVGSEIGTHHLKYSYASYIF